VARVTQFHFISGLPRSGSTLLAAILRQNPAFAASISSPVGVVFSAIQKAVSRGNEAAGFIDNEYRARLLLGTFLDFYRGRYDVVFDTNRMWPSKLSTLVELFPDCRVVCCVRQIAWIMDSIERLVRRNPFELSGIFGYEPGGTVYSRCAALAASGGLVGFALDALREGFYGEHADRLLLVEYSALAKHPRHTVGAIYEWLGLPYFAEHDYENIEQIPGAADFDARLGTPGLHSVRSKAEWVDRETILPPELFASFLAPFWRQNNPKVPVIHVDEPTGSGTFREAAVE
jgi:sulfotransferase